MSDQIALRGMRFAGRHGVTLEERAAPQPIEVDLLMYLDLSRPAASDELADTLDYAAAFEMVRAIVEGKSFRLLEALAAAIARSALHAFEVDEVEVAVRKQRAPLPGELDSVEIRIRRARTAPPAG